MNNYKVIFKIIAGTVTGSVALFMLATIIYYLVDLKRNNELHGYIDGKMIPFIIIMFIIFSGACIYFFTTSYKLIKKEQK